MQSFLVQIFAIISLCKPIALDKARLEQSRSALSFFLIKSRAIPLKWLGLEKRKSLRHL